VRSAAALIGRAASAHPIGQAVWWNADPTISWNVSWTVPADVTAISVVAIGGGGASYPIWNEEYTEVIGYDYAGTGGLGWINYVAVTPGESLTVIVSSWAGSGGSAILRRASTTIVSGGGGSRGDYGGGGGAGYANPAFGTSRGAFNGATQLNGAAGAAKYDRNGYDSGADGPTSLNGMGASGRLCGAAYPSPAGLRIIWGDGRAFPNTLTGDIT